MELGEIISDALTYPLKNIKALIIYIILGVILGIAAFTFIVGASLDNPVAAIGSGILGFIIVLFITFVISGYELDIIKLGINRDPGSPEIDVVRQFINGVKSASSLNAIIAYFPGASPFAGIL